MVSFVTVVLHIPVTSVRGVAFLPMDSLASDGVRARKRQEPDRDWPATPDAPEPVSPPERRRDWGDKILPDVGPHGPGGGEPIAPEEAPDTHGPGGGEP